MPDPGFRVYLSAKGFCLLAAVDAAASALEAAGPGLDLPSQLDKLDGMVSCTLVGASQKNLFEGGCCCREQL